MVKDLKNLKIWLPCIWWVQGKRLSFISLSTQKKSTSKSLLLFFFLQLSLDSDFPLSPNPSRLLLLSVLHIIRDVEQAFQGFNLLARLALCSVMKSISLPFKTTYFLWKEYKWGNNLHSFSLLLWKLVSGSQLLRKWSVAWLLLSALVHNTYHPC